jgi:hypothetical protein
MFSRLLDRRISAHGRRLGPAGDGAVPAGRVLAALVAALFACLMLRQT